MAKAIVQDGLNKEDFLSTLKLVTMPIPKPGPGQVVVHITLRPVNPSDLLKLRRGQVADGQKVTGSEGYGIVHEVGKGVTQVKLGQRVVPFTVLEDQSKQQGTWQEYVCLSTDLVWLVPNSMSDETAAQFVVNPWSAYGMLRDLAVPANEYLLQSASGSALGKQVIQLAKHWSIKTINVVRRAAQKAELLTLGADEVICSSEEDVVARVKEITEGRGAWAALDATCGKLTEDFVMSVKDGGEVFVYGLLEGTGFHTRAADLFRMVRVRPWMSMKEILSSREKSDKCAAEVATLLTDGVFQTSEVEKYNLEDFKLAIAKSEAIGKGKKIMLVS